MARPLKPGASIRMGRRAVAMPGVRSLTDAAPPAAPKQAPAAERRPIDRKRVQHLDPVRAIYRPSDAAALPPALARFVGHEDIFRRVGEIETPDRGRQVMMQCPPHWPVPGGWLPLSDLEILEILEDQDIRAG